MTLTQLLVFGAAALLCGWIFKERWRGGLMLIGSLLALYWLQPATPIRHLDFWLPTASLALTVLVWASTRPLADDRAPSTSASPFDFAQGRSVSAQDADPAQSKGRPTLITGALITAFVLAVALTRY